MKLTNEEILQAFTDAIGGLAVALARQIDPEQLVSDLRKLADEAERSGQGSSAGLLDEIARTVEQRSKDQPRREMPTTTISDLHGQMLGTQAFVRSLIKSHPDPEVAVRAAVLETERVVSGALPKDLPDALIEGVTKAKLQILPP